MMSRSRLLIVASVLAASCIHAAQSFSLPGGRPAEQLPPVKASSPPPRNTNRPQRNDALHVLRAGGGGGGGSSSASVANVGLCDDESSASDILQKSVAVGVVTAAMGFVYGKVLSATVKTAWTWLPNYLSKSTGLTLNPTWFITSMCTVGGLAMGILSSKMKGAFTVADFVSTMSSTPAKADTLPTCRSVLLPLLVLSLVTSTFGFSVGPEAPMVCAGGLVGASLARKWYGDSDARKAEIMSYAGAAGALTAFMGIPIAGSIFALELTEKSAGLASGARDALSPAVVSSVAALVVIRGILKPNAAVGGHFAYGTVGALSGRAMIGAALASGVGGALLGTVFHKVVAAMKGIMWPAVATDDGKDDKKAWKREVLVKTLIGLAVGILSSSFPQTMFWGEGSLQCAVDGQQTAFAATKHGLPALLTGAARVDPSLPFQSAGAAVQVGVAKLLAIALACAGKFPGGIIFPLFFAAAPLAHAFSSLLPGSVLPVVVMSLMASTQAAVTRTPLATVFILALSASASTELSVMLPAVILSSYIGVWVSQLLSKGSYFKYSE